MKKKIYFIALLCMMFVSTKAQWTTIKNGALWTDTNNNDIQAHGSGILQVDDTWYIIGEDRVNGGVNMYSSKNLVDWKFENKIISKKTCEQLENGSRFIERPHLIYNKKYNKFVVWLHWEGEAYAPAEAGVFYCDKINGDYVFHKGFRPFNNMSRDDNVFVDDDGKAYFVSAANHNADLIIYELTDDYLDVKRQVITLWRGGYREAPVIVKRNGTYFLFTSGCTGWEPNQGQYAYSKSLEGPWSNRMNFGNKMTYDTQPTCIIPIQGNKTTTYVYCGDRWQDPGLAESKTILTPLTFSGNYVTLNYYERWDINFETGEWRPTDITNTTIPKSGWKLKYASSQEAGSAPLAFDGKKNTIWHTKYSGGVDKHPHEIQIDLGKEYTFNGLLCTPRQDMDVNGVIRNFAFFVSQDGEEWGTPVAGGWMTWHSEIKFPEVKARYIRLVAYSEFLGNSYASIAEIDLTTNAEAKSSQITPYYKIDNSGWTTNINAKVKVGSKLSFGPQSSGRGSWCISGPNGFISFKRDVSIENMDRINSGKYTIINLNQYNTITCSEINIEIEDNNEIEKGKLRTSVDQARKIYYSKMVGSDILLESINESNRLLGNKEATGDELLEMKQTLDNNIKSYINQNSAIAKDVSYILTTHEDFTTVNPDGWKGEALSGVGNGCGEFRNKNFYFMQNLENLEPGYYILGVQGFYRNGDNDGGIAYKYNREQMNAYLFFGNKSVALKSLYSLRYNGEGNKDGYCDGTKGASNMFTENTSNYCNWIAMYVSSSGNHTIGLKKEISEAKDWCCFNNFKLYYIGENPTNINNDVYNDPIMNDNKIYNLNGIYIGSWDDVKNKLKPGIYIKNNKKIVIQK